MEQNGTMNIFLVTIQDVFTLRYCNFHLVILQPSQAGFSGLLHIHQTIVFCTRLLPSLPDYCLLHQTIAFSSRLLPFSPEYSLLHQTIAFSSILLPSPPDLCLLYQNSAFSMRLLPSPQD